MNVINVSWEVGNMENGGANRSFPVPRAITVKGYIIKVSMAPAANVASQVLAYGCGLTGAPQYGSDAAQFVAGPFIPNPDAWAMGPEYISNPNGFRVGDGSSSNSFLFLDILKSSGEAINDVLVSPDCYSLHVPAGGYLCFHMDGVGAPCDVEMQGIVIYY